MRTENILYEFKGHHETVGACAFIPRSMFSSCNLVMTAASDSSVRVWDQATRGENCMFLSKQYRHFLGIGKIQKIANFVAFFLRLSLTLLLWKRNLRECPIFPDLCITMVKL